MSRHTTRKVYFYRIWAGIDAEGAPVPFDPTPALRVLDALPFSVEGRYQDLGDEEYLCGWVDRADRLPLRARLGKIRHQDLPQVERAGDLTPLNIPADSGIVDQVHVCFFRNDIVGALFNFHGPRAVKLPWYLHKTVEAPTNVRLDPLLRQDVVEQIEAFDYIKVLDIRVRRSFVDALGPLDEQLFEAFDSLRGISDSAVLGLYLGARPYERGGVLGNLVRLVRNVARRLAPEQREGFTRLKVKGGSMVGGPSPEVDLLQEHMVSAKSVLHSDDRTRAIADESAYRAIEEAYDELGPELGRASAAHVQWATDAENG